MLAMSMGRKKVSTKVLQKVATMAEPLGETRAVAKVELSADQRAASKVERKGA